MLPTASEDGVKEASMDAGDCNAKSCLPERIYFLQKEH